VITLRLQAKDVEFETYFKSKTLQYHAKIEESISDVLDQFSDSSFYEGLTFAVQDGKRVRPLIVLLVRDALADGVVTSIDPMRAAVAIELLHLESIIHDDVIDGEDIRRDKPAFHKKFGIPESILSADFVLGLILDIASQYVDSRIGRELSRAALRMSNGEFKEVILNRNYADGKKITLNQYLEVIRDKTASLFQSSARIGALLSGTTRREIDSISDFGMNLGIAYQMQDDLLDWSENSSLARRVGEDRLSLQKLSHEYATNARNCLANIPSGEAKDRLQELAEFAVTRRF
jgi:octaprenyl-diphosphate synthase